MNRKGKDRSRTKTTPMNQTQEFNHQERRASLSAKKNVNEKPLLHRQITVTSSTTESLTVEAQNQQRFFAQILQVSLINFCLTLQKVLSFIFCSLRPSW